MRCMAKDPDVRFRSMDEVLAALKRVGGAAMTATVSGVGATGEYRAMGISGGYGSDSGPNKTSSGPHAGVSGSGAIPAPLLTGDVSGGQHLEKKGSKGVLVGALIGIVALAGVGGVMMMKKDHGAGLGPAASAAASAPKATATAPSTATASSLAASPAMPQFVKVRINTDPDGASVKEDGIEQCSQTPCDITYRGADADAAKDHKLTFSKAGYKVEQRTVKVGDSPVAVKLTRAPVEWRPPPPTPKKNEPEDQPPGFKNLPY
jgi:serine/threonine-protein kinase